MDNSVNGAAPLAAVIMTVYNREKFLRDSIESVLMQETCFPFVLILSEDCGDDGCREICQEYARGYAIDNAGRYTDGYTGNCTVVDISPDSNLGVVANCYRCIRYAMSLGVKYISQLDCDDLFADSHFLAAQVSALERFSECQAVYSDYFMLGEDVGLREACGLSDAGSGPSDDKSLSDEYFPSPVSVVSLLTANNPIVAGSVTYRSEHLSDFFRYYIRDFSKERSLMTQDLPLWLFLRLYGSFACRKRKSVGYRDLETSVSRSGEVEKMELFQRASMQVRLDFISMLDDCGFRESLGKKGIVLPWTDRSPAQDLARNLVTGKRRDIIKKIRSLYFGKMLRHYAKLAPERYARFAAEVLRTCPSVLFSKDFLRSCAVCVKNRFFRNKADMKACMKCGGDAGGGAVGEITQDGVPMPARIWAVVSTALAVFMSCISGSLVNIALPQLVREFGVSSSSVIWIVNGFQLTSVMFLLAVSFLADLKGFRRVYLAGIAGFVFFSLMCALSDSFTMLVICSSLQGLASAGIVGVNLGQLREIYPKRMIGRGIALNSMVVAVASVAGPSLAGAVLSVASWHWLYAVNIPFGILSLILGYRYLPFKEAKIRARFDWIGAGMNALMFFLLVYALMGFAHGMHFSVSAALLVSCVLVGYAYFRREERADSPIFPVDLIRIPLFRKSVFTSSCSFIAQMVAMVSLPFFLQSVAGKSTAEAGFLITPWPIGVILTAPLAGSLINRIHPALLGFSGMMIFAAGVFSLTFLSPESSVTAIMLSVFLCGAGFGLFQTPNNSAILLSSPADRGGAASGMIGVARLIGQCLGAALVAMMFMLIPDQHSSIRVCFHISIGFAVLAATISILRIRNRMPSPANSRRLKD